MATLTKISPSRMGPPRFGNRPHGIDTTVKTYQLTPDQLERLRNGESLDDILKGESEVTKQKIDLTVEEYVEMRKQGMSDAEIAQVKGLTEKQLYHWKYVRKKRISEMEEKLQKQEPVETVDETNQGASTQEVIAYAKYEEVVAERDDLKKQLEELQANMEKEVAHWKELFETTMADKEQLHKENLILENEIQRLKELVSELTERNDRYSDEWIDLHKELRALRLYALEKLQKDVYGA